MGKGKSSSGRSASADLKMDVDTSALDDFHSALPGALDKNVQKALRSLGELILAEAERRVRRGSSRHGGRSRTQAARGLRSTVRSGELVVEATSAGMAPKHEAFPWVWQKPSWQHPVYGTRTTVTQHSGSPGWWAPDKYADEAEKLLRDAGDKAMEEADR